MQDRAKLKEASKIIIKVGTSSLTYPNGKINFDRIEKLTRVIADIQNSGCQVVLVSSGAIAVGSGKLHRDKKPRTIAEKQALAAVGQAELVRIYQKFFGEYGQQVAQILLTRDVVTDRLKSKNARNTLNTLLKMNIIPIINENDTVATDEIAHLGYGDNDRLSADVACLIEGDALIILSDIDGLFSNDPKVDANATFINKVVDITPEIEEIAVGPNGKYAKGGMATKIMAAKICAEHGVYTVIANGNDPAVINEVLQGKDIGTLFVAS